MEKIAPNGMPLFIILYVGGGIEDAVQASLQKSRLPVGKRRPTPGSKKYKIFLPTPTTVLLVPWV